MSNFARKYFDTEEELLAFLKKHKSTFRFVGYSYAQQPDGRWKLVY